MTIALERHRAAAPAIVPGEVLCADDVIGEVRRVVIATPLAVGLMWRPGHSIEVQVAPRTWRRYLVAAAHAAGRLEVVVSLASGGPGAWWAATADVGDPVALRDLRDERLDGAAGASRVIVAGDETALGLHEAMTRARPATPVLGVIEIAPWATWRLRPAPARFSMVPRAMAEPGQRLALELAERVNLDDVVHVVGSSGLVTRCRATLARHPRLTTLITWSA